MSRYLLDENLSATLAPFLGGDCIHATDLSLQPTDDELWQRARAEKRILVTKDADFFDKLLMQGPPPKIVWLRVGNLRRTDLEKHIVRVWPEVTRLLADCDLIEIHHHKIEGIRLGAS